MRLGLTDTIAAVSTAPGASGIGIIRISGEDALLIADKVLDRKISDTLCMSTESAARES